ncbi:MAG TPA: L-2-hydroxyglutarate oxidase [Trueperaceae bacterium]
MLKADFDLAIVGGGIVGLATGLAISERSPELSIVVIEKEADVARHQTGHNSGVVHSGIYYRPGTLRARLCVEGVKLLRQFCEEQELPYDRCGKVIVATHEDELPRLETLFERGTRNGVPGIEMIGPERLREIEPQAAGVKAIWSPNTSIVDYGAIARRYAEILRERGAHFQFGSEVTGIREAEGLLRIATASGEIRSRFLINCAGLYSDEVARMAGHRPDVQVVPFRGEYYRLRPEKRELVRGMIYPVPDPAFPFLGVHLTSTVKGEVEAGPNAVFAFAREGYGWGRIAPRELAQSLRYPGVWQLARKHWRVAAFEYYRSLSKRAFVQSLQRLVPSLREEDVVKDGAGVRAQALNRDGSLVDEFVIISSRRALHVLNAPSPAATASLAIGRHLAAEMLELAAA